MRSPPRYEGTHFRTIAEPRIVEQLLLWGHAHDIRAGRETDARIAVSRSLDRWTKQGLAFGLSPSGERLFDAAEVMNHFIDAGLRDEDDFWETRYVTTVRRLVLDHHRGGAGDGVPAPAGLPRRRFRVRLERDYDLRSFDSGEQVRLRLPAPLQDGGMTACQVSASEPADARVSRLDACFDYQLTVAPGRMVTLTLDASFDAFPGSGDNQPLAKGERELYTRLPEGFIRAGEAAHSPVGRDREPMETLHGIYRQVLESTQCGVLQYGDLEPAGPPQARQTAWVDCQIAAARFCAFCRGLGIPARVVSGYPLPAALAAHHFWAEAWIEGRGWLPYDFMAWHLSAGGRDARWAAIFEGAIDYRMKLQVFPRRFTGTGSIRFPRWWHMVCRAVPGGVEVAYENAQTGALIYRDRFFVLE